jgi:hypothetical protein
MTGPGEPANTPLTAPGGPALSASLAAQAEAEHVSLHKAALRAIRRSAQELAHTHRVREATVEMVDRWGETLDRLGRRD